MRGDFLKYQIGDRVVCAVEHPDGNKRLTVGMTGIVVTRRETVIRKVIYGVRWDERVNGHNCAGECEDGYGWEMYEEELRPGYSDGDISLEDSFDPMCALCGEDG